MQIKGDDIGPFGQETLENVLLKMIHSQRFHPSSEWVCGRFGEGLEKEEPPTAEETKIDYGFARRSAYPQLENQLEAMYDARQGDDTKQKAIDGHIEIVKAKIPKDDKIYTYEELDGIITELKKDSKWTDD